MGDMDGNNDSDASEDLLGEDEDDLIMDEHVQEDPGERSNKGQKSPTRINESDEDMFEGENDDALFEAATQMDEDQTNAGADDIPPERSSLSKIESDAESDDIPPGRSSLSKIES